MAKVHREIARRAPSPRPLDVVSPSSDRTARPSQPSPDDSYRAQHAAPRGPLRPAFSAVSFITGYERGLNLSAESSKLRAKHMKGSPLELFRANPALFLRDMREAYDATLLGRPAPRVTIGGDTHLANFGVIRGPAGEPVWALNDFDQAGTGSPEVDLKL